MFVICPILIFFLISKREKGKSKEQNINENVLIIKRKERKIRQRGPKRNVRGIFSSKGKQLTLLRIGIIPSDAIDVMYMNR